METPAPLASLPLMTEEEDAGVDDRTSGAPVRRFPPPGPHRGGLTPPFGELRAGRAPR